MAVWGTPKRLCDRLLANGAYKGESDRHRAARRIVLGVWWFAAIAIATNATVEAFEGLTWLAVTGYAQAAAPALALAAIRRSPHRFELMVHAVQAVFVATNVVEATLKGGLVESGLVPLWGILGVLTALIALSVRAAFFWFTVALLSVGLSLATPEIFDPLYPVADPLGDVVFTIVAVTGVSFAAMAYFVKQRDRYQEESERLLRNVLPEEIADRLRGDESRIAESFAAATVMFADVADFTPMSSRLSPEELVELLEEIFTDIDVLVTDRHLEKIKTVGDEYMVAAGVPAPRADHAEAIADLALEIRDLTAEKRYLNHEIRFRIGIHSGPVVAGVIGQTKFSYDLWGDTVNTASRLESHGTPGMIQVSADTKELVADSFTCQHRGSIDLKGKGPTETWYLIDRR